MASNVEGKKMASKFPGTIALNKSKTAWSYRIKITLPNGVETIAKGAFSYCSSLEQINIPDTVKTIESGAFFNCTALRSIVLPKTVTRIAGDAFEGSGIRELIYGGTQAEWNENFADLSDAFADITVKCTDGAIAKG